MKIIVNAYSARLGGGQTYLKNIFAHLPLRDDLEILVFAPRDLRLPDHPQIKRVHTRWPTTNPLTRVLWEFFMLPHFLRQEGASVLFCPGGVVATRVPPGCKIVTVFQNMIPLNSQLVSSMPWGFQRLRNIILRLVFLHSMAKADLTIFISNYARQIIEKLITIPKAVTIPHGISDTFRVFQKEIPRPEEAPDGKYLLYVSRFDNYKHHEEIVRAFSVLPLKLRDEFSLVFIGEIDKPEFGYVINLVNDMRLNDKIHILGPLPYETLPSWYRHAYVILFASSCENCPNILLESMASGRPVLSSNVMPMPEFGGEDLIYFSPYDPEDIACSLIKLVTDSEVMYNTSQAALLRSREYDWKLTARETWQSIFDLVRG